MSPRRATTGVVKARTFWLGDLRTGTLHLLQQGLAEEVAAFWLPDGRMRMHGRAACSEVTGFLARNLRAHPSNMCGRCVLDVGSEYHHVYRLYAGRDLVYIGRSQSPRTRLIKHRGTSPWMSTVDRFRFDLYWSVESAGFAEHHAIETEKPAMNRNSRPGLPNFDPSRRPRHSERLTSFSGSVNDLFEHGYRAPRISTFAA